MKITFIGHRDFLTTEETEQQMQDILINLPNNEEIEFFLGGYGNFDIFAKNCCKKYQTTHSLARLYLVTPYISPSYLNSIKYTFDDYDQIIAFSSAEKPQKYTIIKRNYEMVKMADLIIAYVNFPFGGAYKSFLYATRLKKNIINLGTLKQT